MASSAAVLPSDVSAQHKYLLIYHQLREQSLRAGTSRQLLTTVPDTGIAFITEGFEEHPSCNKNKTRKGH